ncbi:MAG: DNRLRE domain-containing protein [Planctomycetota bacterium]|nr:DNRLRE domain-containing protein [Planctomycetota bacterium]
MRSSGLLILAGVLSVSSWAGETRCAVSRDVWLSAANSQEVNTNGGLAQRIKLKVWQEFGLLDFDVAALKGKKVTKATLHVAHAGGGAHGGARGTDLRWFTVSTVSADWVEGKGTQYSEDTDGKGATFNEASYKTRPWSFPGSKCWDVILGNGHTLRCDVDAGDPKGAWFAIELDPRLVQALVAGASYGLLLMDGSTGVDRNCYVSSKESGKQAPYLTVEVEDAAGAPPKAGELKVEALPNSATQDQGAARLSFKVPEGAFAYRIKLNGQELPRWQTPFAAAAGTVQQVELRWLAPGGEIEAEVVALDAAGHAGEAAAAKGKASAKLDVPALPSSEWQPKGGTPPAVGAKLKAWALPPLTKIDPATGQAVLEKGLEDAAGKNSVWDAGSNTVFVSAAKGEIAEFQVVLLAEGGAADGIEVAVEGLEGVKADLWRTWFVNVKGWQAEYAIPLKAGEKLAIPAADNAIPGQKAAAVAVTLCVPASAKPGEHVGKVKLAAGDGSAELALKLKVYDVAIPPEIHFNPELNCYGGPGRAGSDFFFDSFRLAHYHRCAINRVPYGQSGNTNEDWIPKLAGDGKVTDWTEFDRNLGPLFDGSAFKDCPRAGVPTPCVYMPFNENWPLPMLAHYKPGEGVPFKGKHWKAIHDIKAAPPEQAFDRAYQEAFVRCVKDFVAHAEEKGWTRTWFQAYNNNKQYFGDESAGIRGTAWTMDEPFEYLDWHALKFYSRLFHEGIKDAKKTTWQYRGDISRPMWQGSCMDGLMEIMYVGGVFFETYEIVRAQIERMPTIAYAYGACNAQDRPNLESAAWCLKSYGVGADGVLPWQSLGGDGAFVKGDGGNGNALIVDGSKRFGVNAIASFRVHALREGAELVELLRLLQAKRGWGRGHVGLLVGQSIPLGSEFRQKFTDDAAALTFKNLNGDAFVRLKEAVLKLLAP